VLLLFRRNEEITTIISARERAGKKEKTMKSKKINFSDIPEPSDKQLSRMRRAGRPTVGDEPRKLIAIRLDAKVLVGCGRPPGMTY
jgi:uncharacterized protein (DUF4415 family)